MKKVLLGLLFFVAVATQGQTYTIANPLRLGTVNQGTASDSVLVRGVDKIIKYVPRSSFADGKTFVLTAGNGLPYKAIFSYEGCEIINPYGISRYHADSIAFFDTISEFYTVYLKDGIDLIHTDDQQSMYLRFPKNKIGIYTLATIDDIPRITTTAPTSSTATGTKGEIRVVAGYIYWCIATNTWIRAAGTTF